MDLLKKRSSRYVTGVYAVFIILFAFTVSLFYTSRCQHSPHLSDQESDKVKPKSSTEKTPKVTGKIYTAETQLGGKNKAPQSKNIIDDERIIIPPPQKETSNEKKIIIDDLKTPSDEISTADPKGTHDDLKTPSDENSIADTKGTHDELKAPSDEDSTIDNKGNINLKIPSDEKSAIDTKDTNKIPPQPALSPANQKMIIFFSQDSTGLTGNALEKLKAIAEFLLKNTDTGIIIEGYGDSDKNYRHNQRLSQLRAEIVMSYLVRKGIDIARIKAYWMGSENPAGNYDAQKNKIKTHQVEIKYN